MKTLTLKIEYEEPVTEGMLIDGLDDWLSGVQSAHPDMLGWRYNEDDYDLPAVILCAACDQPIDFPDEAIHGRDGKPHHGRCVTG